MSSQEIKAIKNCQSGNMADFGVLYDLYIKKIYAFVYYKTHHKENAEDLTSRVFMKALGSIGSFDLEKGTFQSWIYQIARNSVIDFYRQAKNDANIDDIWDLDDNSDLEKDADMKMRLAKVRKYLRKMKSEHRDIVIMRVWQDLSYKEIGEIMGKSEAAGKMMFRRAIDELKREMPEAALCFLILYKYL